MAHAPASSPLNTMTVRSVYTPAGTVGANLGSNGATNTPMAAAPRPPVRRACMAAVLTNVASRRSAIHVPAR